MSLFFWLFVFAILIGVILSNFLASQLVILLPKFTREGINFFFFFLQEVECLKEIYY